MSRLSAAIFGQPLDLDSEIVDVPEWGVKVKILEPTAERRAELTRAVRSATADDDTDLKELYPALLISCVVDPDDDTPVFTKEDAGAILQREGRVVERIAAVVLKLAGLNAEAVEGPKDGSSETSSDEPSSSSPNG